MIHLVSDTDYDELHQLALQSSLVNLPVDSQLLKQKIKNSQLSFLNTSSKEEKSFFFVMKNTNGKIIGTSQVLSKIGKKDNPYYSLRIFEENSSSFIQLKTDINGPSYLGGLILEKAYRGHPEQLGKQMSLIRFLFIAIYPEFFQDTLHAEIIPTLDSEGKNTFFNKFTSQYINHSLSEINFLSLIDKNKLFAHFPKEKIPLSSLPFDMKKWFIEPSIYSQRALSFLQSQNFYFIDEIDPIDGGPYVQAKVNNIKLIQNVKKVFIAEDKLLDKKVESWLWGMSDQSLFRGGLIKGVLEKNCLFITEKDCLQNNLKTDDPLFVVNTRFF